MNYNCQKVFCIAVSIIQKVYNVKKIQLGWLKYNKKPKTNY